MDEIEIEGGTFTLGPGDFNAVNPNTGTAPVFRTPRDADLTRGIYARVPVLVDHSKTPPATVFPVKYATMFHTVKKLKSGGAYPVAGNRWKKGATEYVPLYEGKMIHQFDHRAASVTINKNNLHNAALSVPTTLNDHANPEFSITPQYRVAEQDIDWPTGLNAVIGFRDIARVTDARTVIATTMTKYGLGNTLLLIIPHQPKKPDDGATEQEKRTWDELVQSHDLQFRTFLPLLLANLISFVLDYIARQKVQSTHLSWYIVEQLPVLPDASYDLKIGKVSARDLVRQEVLKLTYTAHDMKPFARDMGYEGAPFIWNEDDRRHSRVRLDALYFMLYDIEREDAEYILSTFPIVKKHDQAAHNRDLILNYMNTFKAGDTESRIAV